MKASKVLATRQLADRRRLVQIICPRRPGTFTLTTTDRTKP